MHTTKTLKDNPKELRAGISQAIVIDLWAESTSCQHGNLGHAF